MSNPNDSHGHDSLDSGVGEIIPVGSWQDRMLELVAAFALAGLVFWGFGLSSVAVPEHGAEHHAADSHAADGHTKAAE